MPNQKLKTYLLGIATGLIIGGSIAWYRSHQMVASYHKNLNHAIFLTVTQSALLEVELTPARYLRGLKSQFSSEGALDSIETLYQHPDMIRHMIAEQQVGNILERMETLPEDAFIRQYYDQAYDHAWLIQIRAASKLQDKLDAAENRRTLSPTSGSTHPSAQFVAGNPSI
jgi:hypothetical protein